MPNLPSAPGVYVEEVPHAVHGPIVGVPTSVAAFLGTARRGPVYAPVRVRSRAEFEGSFGPLLSTSEMGYAVRHFFENGGDEAIIVRVHEGAELSAVWRSFGGVDLRFVASSPGAWGDALRLRFEASDNGFDLAVLTVGVDGHEREVERFRSLSSTPGAERYVGAVLAARSAHLRVDPNPPAPADAVTPITTTGPGAPSVALTGGADGAPQPGIARYDGSLADAPGLQVLDGVEHVNLLCVPFPTTAGALPTAARLAFWSETAIPYCEKRRAMAIIDGMPEWASADDVHAADRSRLSSPFAALYVPNLRAPDPLDHDRPRDFPPCGAVAGVIARTDATRGVWKAPAGVDATLHGVVDLRIHLTDAEQDTLHPERVNALRSFPATGPVVWGARTTSVDPDWRYVPVRRLASFIEASALRGTAWAAFEPNDERLWIQLRFSLEAFLAGLWRQGAFAGPSLREACFVRCDRETMTQADIDRGVVRLLIGFAPLRPAEFVVLSLQQLATPGGS